MKTKYPKTRPPNAPPGFHLLTKPTGAACNLDCAYCFFLDKEALYPNSKFRMSDEMLEEYIRQLIEAHEENYVNIAWQGGEPTLMGLDFYRRSIELVEKYRRPNMEILYTIQTNGTLLDDEWCAFFKENNFLIGISIDGPQELHDIYRRDKGGGPTFMKVMRGLRCLQKHEVDFNVLVTINHVNADFPLEVYRFLRDKAGVDWMQFIPIVERLNADGRTLYQQGSTVSSRSVKPEQYGRFLNAIFDEWIFNDVGKVFVQTFEAALANWLQMPSSGICIFNETCGTALAMEHNGDIYSCDHFVEPDYLLGNIQERHMVELVALPKQIKFGLDKRDTLPKYCQECDVRFACHGGCPKNRFTETPDGEQGLNYLCEGYKDFFHHINFGMQLMAKLLRTNQDVGYVMQMMKQTFDDVKPNDLCPCGSGKRYKDCHGKKLPHHSFRSLPDPQSRTQVLKQREN